MKPISSTEETTMTEDSIEMKESSTGEATPETDRGPQLLTFHKEDLGPDPMKEIKVL